MTTAAYLRVSTERQSIDQQHDAIAAAGITPDRIFTDTASGRAGSNRPGWTECMGDLREGDHLVVVAVDRLGRSVREVATALHELTSRGVYVRSLREGVDTSTPTGRAVTSIMATIAELELELGKERRAASREARITRGLPATKPMKLDAAQQKRVHLASYNQSGVADLMMNDDGQLWISMDYVEGRDAGIVRKAPGSPSETSTVSGDRRGLGSCPT